MYVEFYFVIGIGISLLDRVLAKEESQWNVLGWFLHIFFWPVFIASLLLKLKL